MRQHHVNIFIKHSATIVFTALLSFVAIKADLEIFDFQPKTNEINISTGIFLLLVVIAGWYSVIVKLKYIRFKNVQKKEIGKFIKMLFYTGVFMNILLSFAAMKTLFGVMPDIPAAPVYVKSLFILVIIVTLAVWFYELSIIQRGEREITYEKPRHSEVLSDILMMFYAGLTLVFIWKNLIVSNLSPITFSNPVKDIVSLILLGLVYMVLCLPTQRVYYMEEVYSFEDKTSKKIVYFNIVAAIVGAILPLIIF